MVAYWPPLQAWRIAFAAALLPLIALASAPANAQNPADRLQLWDLQLGGTIDEMPDPLAFRNYACGSNGGPPLRPLSGWADYRLCRPDGNGLREVYFEYDNEAEYILRALSDPRAVRFVGTTEQGFPIVASALFDDAGTLRGLRLVTDPRANYSADKLLDLDSLRGREEFYLLGPFVGAHAGISPASDCISVPLAEGESEVASNFVKLDCTRTDEQAGVRYLLQTRYFRKPGQHARDPQTGQLTVGQYESSTRFEEYQIGYGPTGPSSDRSDDDPTPMAGGGGGGTG